MRKPRRLFRSRRNEADIVVVTEANGRNIILGDPELSDLQGYSKEIRSRWWKAYREEGVPNPIVVAVHKRSRLARERGLTEGSDFTFLALDSLDAVSEGWLHPDLAVTPNRPPSMGIIPASGESIEAHVVSDMTESGVLGPSSRGSFESSHDDCDTCADIRVRVRRSEVGIHQT